MAELDLPSLDACFGSADLDALDLCADFLNFLDVELAPVQQHQQGLLSADAPAALGGPLVSGSDCSNAPASPLFERSSSPEVSSATMPLLLGGATGLAVHAAPIASAPALVALPLPVAPPVAAMVPQPSPALPCTSACTSAPPARTSTLQARRPTRSGRRRAKAEAPAAPAATASSDDDTAGAIDTPSTSSAGTHATVLGEPGCSSGGDAVGPDGMTKMQLAALKRRAPEVDWRSITDPTERSKQRRLAKNRVTAARSRDRKKEQWGEMEARLAALEADNAALRAALAAREADAAGFKATLAALAAENAVLGGQPASPIKGAGAAGAGVRSSTTEPAVLVCVAIMHLVCLLLSPALAPSEVRAALSAAGAARAAATARSFTSAMTAAAALPAGKAVAAVGHSGRWLKHVQRRAAGHAWCGAKGGVSAPALVFGGGVPRPGWCTVPLAAAAA